MPVRCAVDHEVVAGAGVVLLELDLAAAGRPQRRAARGEHVLALVPAAAAEVGGELAVAVRAADRELVAQEREGGGVGAPAPRLAALTARTPSALTAETRNV